MCTFGTKRGTWDKGKLKLKGKGKGKGGTRGTFTYRDGFRSLGFGV